MTTDGDHAMETGPPSRVEVVKACGEPLGTASVGPFSALREWFLREWYEGWDIPEAENAATAILRLLRALPVEQRMEAMGMTRDQFNPNKWVEAMDTSEVGQ